MVGLHIYAESVDRFSVVTGQLTNVFYSCLQIDILGYTLFLVRSSINDT